MKTILLVDDEPNVLNALRRLFVDEGYRILTSPNGQDALLKLAENSVQVIISDHRMPSMTGAELFAQVKILYPDIIRIMLSGYADFEAIKGAVNHGEIDKFVNKPWEDDQLIKDIQQAFLIYDTQREKHQQHLINLMRLDKLTGLNNRIRFNHEMAVLQNTAAKNQTTLGIMLIDIADFDALNNKHGQALGDFILQHVATKLGDWVNSKNKLARIAGDIFAMALEDNLSIDQIENMSIDVIRKLNEEVIFDNNAFNIVVNVGVSLYPEHGHYPEELVKAALIALRESKKLGANQFKIYSFGMVKQENNAIVLGDELSLALEKNELMIFYQPIVEVNTNKIVGAEALLRWQHPKYGLINPDQFLPLCESKGLMVQIGMWVIRTACEKLKIWRDDGHANLRVSVNLSMRQFSHPGLPKLIQDIVKKAKIPANCLDLEIKESIVSQESSTNVELLQTLRRLDLHLSIDDFGTGYSSLAILKSFPLNMLKIDRSFIHEMAISTNSFAIVKAIIDLGKSLGLSLIAEGVETQQQLDILKNLGCDYMQGFLYSKAIPEEKFAELLNQAQNNYLNNY